MSAGKKEKMIELEEINKTGIVISGLSITEDYFSRPANTSSSSNSTKSNLSGLSSSAQVTSRLTAASTASSLRTTSSPSTLAPATELTSIKQAEEEKTTVIISDLNDKLKEKHFPEPLDMVEVGNSIQRKLSRLKSHIENYGKNHPTAKDDIQKELDELEKYLPILSQTCFYSTTIFSIFRLKIQAEKSWRDNNQQRFDPLLGNRLKNISRTLGSLIAPPIQRSLDQTNFGSKIHGDNKSTQDKKNSNLNRPSSTDDSDEQIKGISNTKG